MQTEDDTNSANIRKTTNRRKSRHFYFFHKLLINHNMSLTASHSQNISKILRNFMKYYHYDMSKTRKILFISYRLSFDIFYFAHVYIFLSIMYF